VAGDGVADYLAAKAEISMSFLPELTVLRLLVAVPAAFVVAWARVKRRPIGQRTIQLLKLAGFGLVYFVTLGGLGLVYSLGRRVFFGHE
jgi:drug/metabolite transporter (DMT)-like permease